MPKTKAAKKSGRPGPVPRTPTAEERRLERIAVERLRSIGGNMGYNRLSSRVAVIFQQYRYSMTNMQRRHRVYRALSGLLTFGLRRAPAGTFYVYNQELLQVVREAYPSGDDEAWLLTNQSNHPTLDVGVDDLFDDKP